MLLSNKRNGFSEKFLFLLIIDNWYSGKPNNNWIVVIYNNRLNFDAAQIQQIFQIISYRAKQSFISSNCMKWGEFFPLMQFFFIMIFTVSLMLFSKRFSILFISHKKFRWTKKKVISDSIEERRTSNWFERIHSAPKNAKIVDKSVLQWYVKWFITSIIIWCKFFGCCFRAKCHKVFPWYTNHLQRFLRKILSNLLLSQPIFTLDFTNTINKWRGYLDKVTAHKYSIETFFFMLS